MQSRMLLSLLLPVALACSADAPIPTEIKPSFLGACQTVPTLTATPSNASVPAQSSATATFLAKSNCASLAVWTMTASRTGAVASTSAANPVNLTLNAGESKNVTVPYTTGTTGTGTVVLKASGGSPTISTSATLLVTVGQPLGIPFGIFAFFTGTSQTHGVSTTQWFNLSVDGVTAASIISRIIAARQKGLNLLTAMTGGAHSNYMSTINGVFQFDMAKWKDSMAQYDTSPIRTAVADAVRDGIIIGNSVMDEPNVSGGAEGGGNTWGPPGTMNKARVDTMCLFVRNIFFSLPVGVVHRHDRLEPSVNYSNCEFIVDQYVYAAGDLTTFRQAALDFAARSGIRIAFSMNVLNGGPQDAVGAWDCPGSGGLGDKAPNCRMNSAQVLTVGQTLGPSGCAMAMWKYDSVYMSDADNKNAFTSLRSLLDGKLAKSCHRP